MKVLTRREQARHIEVRIAQILRWGVLASAALLTVSLPWVVVRNGTRQTTAISVGEALGRLPALDPRGLAALGVLLLVATPIFQLVASAFLFWRKHDRLYLGFTLLVSLIIAGGALLAMA